MKKTAWIWVLLLLLVALAAFQSRRLAALRRAGLPEAYAGYTANEPPALSFILAGLGGFRGIASEVLWFRAERLQDEGRYMELVQLSDWLTRLEPHAAETWVYMAWNLAYNISAMYTRPEDRLRWVKNGVLLLRDDAIRFNPKEGRLFRELAWMYQNKIGDSLDRCHLAYKRELANALAPYLAQDGTVVVSAANRERLKDRKLDLDRMLELQRRYGPLDWRLGESHAIYWASYGLPFTTGPERLMTRRLIYQSLMFLVLRGKLNVEYETEWNPGQNLAFAVSAADELAATYREFPSRNMQKVFLRFLGKLAVLERSAGNEWMSRFFYERLVKALPEGMNVPSFEEVIREASAHL
ncbi:MAG: hypothetical protein J6Z49_00535 [Kiritimatiellae bacterium]|nr:hypothetical protein [Kiritimatiellia bacterium]